MPDHSKMQTMLMTAGFTGIEVADEPEFYLAVGTRPCRDNRQTLGHVGSFSRRERLRASSRVDRSSKTHPPWRIWRSSVEGANRYQRNLQATAPDRVTTTIPLVVVHRAHRVQLTVYSNAVAESFFKSLKSELVDWKHYKTRDEARRDIFQYIEVFYNRQRLHSKLGYMSVQFELAALALAA